MFCLAHHNFAELRLCLTSPFSRGRKGRRIQFSKGGFAPELLNCWGKGPNSKRITNNHDQWSGRANQIDWSFTHRPAKICVHDPLRNRDQRLGKNTAYHPPNIDCVCCVEVFWPLLFLMLFLLLWVPNRAHLGGGDPSSVTGCLKKFEKGLFLENLQFQDFVAAKV